MSGDTFASRVQAVTRASNSEQQVSPFEAVSSHCHHWCCLAPHQKKNQKPGMPFLDYAHIITYLWAKRELFKLSLTSYRAFPFHCVSLSSFLASLTSHFPGWTGKCSRAGSCLLVCWGSFCKMLKNILKAVWLWLCLESVQQSLD